MKRCKRVFLILETAMIVVLCAGCWNYREIEKNSIVAGIAIDKGTNEYKYHLTYEVLSFNNGKENRVEPILLESDGDSVFDAIRRAVTMTDKKLYFSNCNVIIVSKELATEGITQITDFFIRDAEPRITLTFTVSDEDTAAKILNAKMKSKEPVSFKIRGMLEQSQDVFGHVLPVPLFEMYNILSSNSQALTLPSIRVVEVGEDQEPQLVTNVVFRQDKMVGNMPEDENLYYMILRGQMKSGILQTVVPGKENISLEILKSSVKMKPVISGSDVTMKIQIKMIAGIGEESSEQDKYKVENGQMKEIEEAASKTVKEGAEKLIHDMQKNYNADVVGFGTIINQDEYEYWKKNSQNWDRIFPNVKCEIEADVKIESSAVAAPKEGG